MEVPPVNKFTGLVKYSELLEKLLDIVNNLSVHEESKNTARNGHASKTNRKQEEEERKNQADKINLSLTMLTLNN